MIMSDAKYTGPVRIVAIERMKNSVNGNPRFRIAFSDGTMAVTQTDAGFCYGIENREYRDADVMVAYTRAGKIADVKLA
jgi:hypothetical protein